MGNKRAPLSKLAEQSTPRLAGATSFVTFIGGLFSIMAVVSLLTGGSTGGGNERAFSTLTLMVCAPLVVWGVFKERAAKAAWLDRNDCDFDASKAIEAGLTALVSAPPATIAPSSGMRRYKNLRVGEVIRHFDIETNASVEGWLGHKLGVGGFGAGVQFGRVGLGIGQVGISGQSEVHLSLSGTTRANLLADGFVAILEEDVQGNGTDTVRVVVPSEPACREWVGQFITSLGKTFGSGSHCDGAFTRKAPVLQASLSTDVSYVSDRLNAILRVTPERRPTVSVTGAVMTEHAILDAAIQFEKNGKWYQLFPAYLINGVAEAVGHGREILEGDRRLVEENHVTY